MTGKALTMEMIDKMRDIIENEGGNISKKIYFPPDLIKQMRKVMWTPEKHVVIKGVRL